MNQGSGMKLTREQVIEKMKACLGDRYFDRALMRKVLTRFFLMRANWK
jgi:hypothetical protein